MDKNSNPPLAIPYIIISLYINIFFTINAFLFHSLEEAINFLKIIILPFFLIIIIYLIYRKYHPSKVNINYKFLLISILSFTGIMAYYISYIVLVLDNFSNIIVFLLGLIFMISTLLSFIKNYKIAFSIVEYFILPLFCFLTITFAFILLSYSFTNITCIICNPNRYEFVKHHYFSPQEVISFPKKIPENARNIVFRYSSYNGDKSLKLQFNLENGQNRLYKF
ncbi:MAG: hypothetical protein HFJ53_04625 [Clostridia bacterium]|jgi:hypothetical protein|nr:hypothetical protein [Clostridia bacterium]